MRNAKRNLKFLLPLQTLIVLLFMSNALMAEKIRVNSLEELLPYLDDDSVDVVVAPGTYTISAIDIAQKTFGTPRFEFRGNYSTYDFTGVTINFAADIYTYGFSMNHLQTFGNYNVIKNLTMVDLCDVNGQKVEGGTNIIMDGRDNRIEGCHITVRGSYPYGYGDAFGKGGSYTIKHYKHCAFLVRGLRNHALNDTIIHRAYGHALFMQAASYPTIEGCYIEGETRSTDDMLAETSGPAFDIDFMTDWGYRLQPGYMMCTGEEGIRAYNGGNTIVDGVAYERGTDNPTVLNCTIVRMRAGVTLTHATGTKYVEGVTAIGCERGFAIGAGDIVDCYADAQNGPVFGVDYESNKNMNVEITVLPYEGETYNGGKHLAFIIGSGHNITFKSAISNPDQSLRIDIGGDKRTNGSQGSVEDYAANSITLNNETNYPVILDDNSKNCTGVSGGMVTDFGSNNSINHQAMSIFDVQAEDYSSMSGVAIDSTEGVGVEKFVTTIATGDWMAYEIDVPFTGTYSFDYRVASASEDGGFAMMVDSALFEDVSFDATGGAKEWTTVGSTSSIFLTEGMHTLNMTASSSAWSMDWFSILVECVESPIVPYIEEFNVLGESQEKIQSNTLLVMADNTVSLIPETSLGGTWSWTGPNGFTSSAKDINLTDIQKSDSGAYYATYTNACGFVSTETFHVDVDNSLRIQAEDYTNTSGVETELTSDVSGDSSLTSIDSDDWMEYEVYVPFSATYNVNYRVSSETGGDFIVSNGSTILDKVTFEYQTWSTLTSDTLIYLKQGLQTIRVTSNSVGWKMNWLELEAIQNVRACELPFSHDGFDIRNTTMDWSSKGMDISCEESVGAYITIAGIGDLESTDYLNIYYKVDGGDMIEITEKTGAVDRMMVSVTGISGSVLELIIQSNSGSNDNYYSVSNISVLNLPDPFARIEAEDYDDVNGTKTQSCNDTGGGENVGTIKGGNWLMYSGLNMSDVHSINVRVASIYTEGIIEVRLGSEEGTLIGRFDMPTTGSWSKWVTVSASLDNVVGFHDLYLVFLHPTTSVGNINWFELSPDILPNSEALLTSSVYTVNQENRMILNVPMGLLVSDFESNLVLSEGATVTTYQLDKTTEASEVTDGCIVIVTAEDNISTTTYSIEYLSSEAIATSEKYTVDQESLIISNVPEGTLTLFVKHYLDISEGATIEGYEADGITVASSMYAGYKVVITSEDGTTTTTYTINGTSGIDEMEMSHMTFMYPNPVIEILTINDHANAYVEIYNTMGEKVFADKITSNRHSVSMQSMNSGIYIIKITVADGVSSCYKVIKK